MTVSAQGNKQVYIGNGFTKQFPFNFELFAKDNIHLYLVNLQGETQEILGGFNISFNTANPATGIISGGYIEYPSGEGTILPKDWKLVILRKVDNLQPTDLVSIPSYMPRIVENSLDLIVMQIQQLAEEVTRCVKKNIGAETAEEINPAYFTNLSEELKKSIDNFTKKVENELIEIENIRKELSEQTEKAVNNAKQTDEAISKFNELAKGFILEVEKKLNARPAVNSVSEYPFDFADDIKELTIEQEFQRLLKEGFKNQSRGN